MATVQCLMCNVDSYKKSGQYELCYVHWKTSWIRAHRCLHRSLIDGKVTHCSTPRTSFGKTCQRHVKSRCPQCSNKTASGGGWCRAHKKIQEANRKMLKRGVAVPMAVVDLAVEADE